MRGWESQASGYKGQTVTPRTATALRERRERSRGARVSDRLRRYDVSAMALPLAMACWLYPQASAPSLLYLVAMAHRVACWLIHVHERSLDARASDAVMLIADADGW